MPSVLNTVAMLIVICIKDIIANDNTFRGFDVPCMDTSPQCVKESFPIIFSDFVRGMPSLGVKPSDPFIVDKLNLEMPGGLFIEFNDGQTKGLRKCSINSASVNGDKVNVALHCNFTTKGKYRSHGRMLMFPIDGKGEVTIICKNLKLDLTFTLGTTERNGKKHLLIKEHNIKHSYEGQVFYNITNLFKGNPEISKVILEFMNKNWRAVAEEFGGPIINVAFQSVLNNIEKLIQTVPVDQLFKSN